jgi:hypothetical protein
MVEENSADTVFPVDVLALGDIGDQPKTLADQLAAISKHTERRNFRALEKAYDLSGDDEYAEQLSEMQEIAIRQTLMGLAQFRRSYDYWERLVAEYALKNGFSQRQAAGHLGVAVSTINRWAQHPLSSDNQEQ